MGTLDAELELTVRHKTFSCQCIRMWLLIVPFAYPSYRLHIHMYDACKYCMSLQVEVKEMELAQQEAVKVLKLVSIVFTNTCYLLHVIVLDNVQVSLDILRTMTSRSQNPGRTLRD